MNADMRALQGSPTLCVSGPHWKKKSCLGLHFKYNVTCNHTKKSHNVLSKFTILCWATFTAILGLGHRQPVGHRLDAPARVWNFLVSMASRGTV